MTTSCNYGTWRDLEALNVSWNELLALVLNVKEWKAWISEWRWLGLYL
jgi:hypothetical protein